MVRYNLMKHKRKGHPLAPNNVLAFLWKEERRSGVLLLIAAAIALFMANSSWSDVYFGFIKTELTLGSVTFDIKHWVSEGLMALFFLVVTLEVKRELVDGELRTWRKASFPVFAAVGGMIVPAAIYTFLNPTPPESSGWAIPIATDIAIAVGVLALLGDKIPKNLRVFLLALAIIDDIGSILVIALFYNHPTNSMAIIAAVTFTILMLVARRRRYWIPLFAILALGLWYSLLLAGVAGTMAGVIVAACAPLVSSRSNRLQSSEKIEDLLLPLTAFIIVPLFVFCNAGLVFESLSLGSSQNMYVFLGIIAGLAVGKPLGIVSASWLATQLRLTKRPAGISWSQLSGIGFVAGIGFTISLFIADLAFAEHSYLQNDAIFGVFVGSIVSSVVGLLILRAAKPARN